MTDLTSTTPWRDRLLLAGLFVCLSPIAVPMLIWDTLSFHWRLWRFLRGGTAESWQRCAVMWARVKCACGGEIGPSMVTPFVHSLTEQFARYHPDGREFLIAQLLNPDPYLAAYAFKCLIRFGPLTPADIPNEALSRSEEIHAQRWGCYDETMPLGQYMSEYFILTGQSGSSGEIR